VQRCSRLVTALVGVAALTDLSSAATSRPVVVPFEPALFPYIVIRVPAAAHTCEAMLFDTGTNTTVLEPSLAARGGLAAGRETSIESLGESVPAIAGEVHGIGFEGIPPQRPRRAVAASLAGLRRVAASIRGLYGHDWLAGTDYLIDYRRKRLVMGPAGTLNKPAGGRRAPLTWASRCPAIAVTVRTRNVEPFTVRLVLDSGADAVVLLGSAARTVSAAAADKKMLIASGFGIHEVAASDIRVSIGGRERSLVAQLRGDLDDREEDGLLPTSIFRSIFVGTADRIVIFDGDAAIPRSIAPCRP